MRVVFIPKSSRNGYILTKDFRPISLISFVLKTESRSTDTDLHHLVGRVEAQLEVKEYVLGIEGAFDSTSYNVIRKAMTRYGIPAALADWTQSMLTGRTLTASHVESVVHGFPAKGCLQRGVLSPLLWCLMVDEFLEKLRKAGFPVYDYADDVAIVCQSKGLRANPSKTKAMSFTKKYKPEAIEPLRFWHEKIEYVQVMGKSWGIKLNPALWIYKSVLLPRLTYAAVIWWPRVEMTEARNLLRSLQGNYLRAAAGAMRITPTEALEVALRILPLNQQIISTAGLTAYRLRCQGEWRQFGTGHTKLGCLHKFPFTLKQDRIPRIYQVNKAFSVNLSTRAEWYLEQTTALEQVSHGLPSEGLGYPGMCKTLSKETMSRRIHSYTDSKAAIGALAKTTTESSVVPGHQGIRDNEIANGLAKLGTLEEPAGQKVGVPFAVEKNYIKDRLKREHQDSWKKLKSCRQAKLLMSQPSSSRAKELLAVDKDRLRLSIGLLTGH
ncbi:uncharacterized protein LOC109862370 [Pseudomyrmex gracilis]|uniref:uncharacterized protein LOC109862370 n=1 Tax=Pseudomyrmex gracilis TaxID=219809 RepID=UPI0009951231|nr:uncharacterized protein LOC109862370 [Pseudomyrmex gracilis]